MEISLNNIEMYDNNYHQNNSLLKDMDIFSSENKTLSNITKNFITSNSNMNTLEELKKAMKNVKIIYPNNEDIPLIKIKNENLLESGEKIEKYINELYLFDDSKFDKCSICKEKLNIFFCDNCKRNMCDICYKNCIYKNHNLINLSNELNKIVKIIIDIKKIIYDCLIKYKENKDSDGIIKQNKNFYFSDDYEMDDEIGSNTMDYSYDIILIEAFIEKNYLNYFHFKNIENCFNYLVKKYSLNFINGNLITEKNIELGRNKININEDSKNNNDFIIIGYKIDNGLKKIKIFGEAFCKKYKNENICKIIYENKKYDLSEYFKTKKSKKTNILEIKLTGINNIIDANNMFHYCSNLISLPDISKWDTKNITSMRGMFQNCSNLISLPDISKWNTKNVTNMGYMFYDCSSLKSLPDISKWNTNNVINLSYMFSNCSSLLSLPDMSKWNTNNVNDMREMFSNCYSLISLPDISKWDTSNVNNMRGMFFNCYSLISLPDLSKWNINNVTDISGIFQNCSKLISLPDISKWNINNINNLYGMLYNCSNLISLPDISNWNTNNVTNMSRLFYNCSKLISLPDISKWKTNNNSYISGIFNNCSSLISLPDISKWNVINSYK